MQQIENNKTSLQTDTQNVWQGRFLEIKSRNGWEFVERKCTGVVALIAVTEHNELVLTEQFRPPVSRNVLDLPAGLVGDSENIQGEDRFEAAGRELTEETGYSSKDLTRLFDKPSSAGLTSEIISYVHAKNIEKVSEGGGVENEKITTHVVPLSSLETWLKSKERHGVLIDPKIDVALHYLSHAAEHEQTVDLSQYLALSQDRVLGMMSGISLGDALGCAVETLTAAEIKNKYGVITGFVEAPATNTNGIQNVNYSDDTQLSLACMRVLSECSSCDMQKMAEAHIEEHAKNKNGWGRTTSHAIERLINGVSWKESGETYIPGLGEGNGVAMKIAPLATFFSISGANDETILSTVTDFTRMTHASNLAVASAMAHTAAIMYCLSVTPEDFKLKDFAEFVIAKASEGVNAIPLSRSADLLIERLCWLKEADKLNDEEIIELCNGGTSLAVDSIPLSLLFFARNPTNISPLFDAINAGGDTDTNASMVAALLGALNGQSIFPSDLLTKVSSIEQVKSETLDFCDTFKIEEENN